MQAEQSKDIRAYLAGPDGFSETTKPYLYGTLIPLLHKLDIEVINPWDLTTPEEIERVYGMPLGPEREEAIKKFSWEVGERNCAGIERCTIVIANLDGVDVDSGTASEIAAASVLGKVVFGRRSDMRVSGEPGQIVNLQVEHWIKRSKGHIARSHAELADLLREYVKQVRRQRD